MHWLRTKGTDGLRDPRKFAAGDCRADHAVRAVADHRQLRGSDCYVRLVTPMQCELHY